MDKNRSFKQQLSFVTVMMLLFQFKIFGQVDIEISNPLGLDRKEEVVEIPWEKITSIYPPIDTFNFQVIDIKTKKQIPWQLEYCGTKQVQHLLLLVSVGSNNVQQLRLQKGTSTIIAAKTYSRYVPERKDDFAWENDKIAFRMYGTALEKSPKENAFGIDVWVKRTNKLIINERYKTGNYHTDLGDGLDYYHVGLTLGAGGIAPYVDDSLWFSKNYRQWKILDNGPLRSTFQLDYDEWNVKGKPVDVVKIISLDAGSQLSKMEIIYSFNDISSIPVAVGIIKREQPGTQYFDEANGIMGYWEPMHGKDGITGVGCISTTPVQQSLMTKEHLLTVGNAKPEERFVYYTGAAWNKAGEITDAKSWFDYLSIYNQKLKNPLIIKLKKPK